MNEQRSNLFVEHEKYKCTQLGTYLFFVTKDLNLWHFYYKIILVCKCILSLSLIWHTLLQFNFVYSVIINQNSWLTWFFLYIGVFCIFFLLDAHACMFVYKNNDGLKRCNKTFPQHTSLGSAYKLSHWMIAAKTIFLKLFKYRCQQHTSAFFTVYSQQLSNNWFYK
jgi:hypothetical protein